MATRKPPATKTPATKTPATKKAATKTAATTTPSARGRGVTVEAYIAALSPAHKAIAERLVALVAAVVPKATSSIKWGQPVFEHDGPLAWLKASTHHVGFGFWRGAELPDPKGLLEGEGARMRHVKLRDATTIDETALKALVRAAAAANKTNGDPTKRRH